MAVRGKKRGRDKIQKFEYLENERSFFVKPKIFFHNFLSVSRGEIYEISGYEL